MAMMTETCSVCSTSFEVQFRYQMEERDGGFAFYCSQKCLEKSHRGGEEDAVVCDACAKRFRVELVSQVFYLGKRRHYACSSACRAQVLEESEGRRLGEITDQSSGDPEPSTEQQAAQTAAMRRAMFDEVSSVRSMASSSVPSASAVPARNALIADRPSQTPSVARPAMASQPVSRAEAVSLIPSASAAPRPIAPASSRVQGNGEGSGRPRIIAVFNHKGGTGKTTTSVSVAAGLSMRGQRVLLVDTDAQGNVAVSLNVKSDRSLYHVMVMGLSVKMVAQVVRPGLHLVASNETLAAAELYLAGRQNRDRVLRDRLMPIAGDFDYVILDCSPSLSLMNQNALVFADSVLVPVACDYLSLVGVRQVVKTVRNVNQLLRHPVRIWGVLPTLYDARANICREAIETLKQHFGDRCLPPIRSAIRVKEAPAHGQTIFEYADGTPAAEDYRCIVDKIISGQVSEMSDSTSQAEAVSA